MQQSRASKTAEQVALSRAIETLKPKDERVCDDPLARHFLGPAYRMLLFTRPLRDAIERAIESRFAGHHWYVIARTRYFDDVLQAELAQAPEQLVILGAGYDSRAHRFAGALRQTRVFEVDHPATSQSKQARMRSALGASAGAVTYVPVDFNAQRLAQRLDESGYHGGVRTLFLWEGVTPYLNQDAVDDVLAFVRDAGRGSAVLFDYILKSVVKGSCQMRGAANEWARMQQTVEPMSLGFEEREMASYLAARGFGSVTDVGGADLQARYFARWPARNVKPWWRIALARVA